MNLPHRHPATFLALLSLTSILLVFAVAALVPVFFLLLHVVTLIFPALP